MQGILVSPYYHPHLGLSDYQASASHLATGAANTASGLVSSAITAVGYGQSPAEEHLHRSTMPPDAVVGQVMKMDSDGLAVFEDAGVRHEVLVKLNKLAMWVFLGRLL